MEINKYHKFIFPAIAVLAAAGGLVYYGYFYAPRKAVSEQEAIRSKVEKFINENLIQPGATASIKDIIEENGLYKITVDISGQEVISYASGDGKNFFPEAVDMDSVEDQNGQRQEQQPVAKNDVPEVRLFVMSYCPYGLQAEKGILPVIDLLGSKIKFNLEFVDYAMHGEKEIEENLRQYCIEQQGLTELTDYLKCFTEKGNSTACLREIQINSGALNDCVASTDARFGISENLKNQSAWISGQYPPFDVNKEDVIEYDVQGSPTLVINGVEVSAARDPQSILEAICSGFSNPPSECGQKISGDAPSPGFGVGVGSKTDASCGD